MNPSDFPLHTAFSLQCREYGLPPTIEAQLIDDAALPGPDEVIVDVRYAAFNFTDYVMVQGRYQTKPALPFVPGLDAAGIVRSVGRDVQAFKPGDKVVSSGVPGAWSSLLRAPENQLVAVPDPVSLQDAVASINAQLTAYHALTDRGRVQAGDRVLVLGANGAVGRGAVQIAQHLHADVYTAARGTADQIRLAHPASGRQLQVGRDELKNGLRTLLGTDGANVIVDPVGDCFTEAAVRNLAWRGRLLVIGFAGGDIPKVPTNLLLLKGASICGVYCGGLLVNEQAEFKRQLSEMLALIACGALKPTPHESLPASDFTKVWTRFSAAGPATKVLLSFDPLPSMPEKDL